MKPLDYSKTTEGQRTMSRILGLAAMIHDLKEVPAGHLYAHVMGQMDIHEFEAAIAVLVRAKYVRRAQSHMLTWIGPAKKEEQS